jgi:branched-chain amino acid transport system substrate-binding protein
LKAVQAGVREINDAGGLMGLPVDLVISDDRCDEDMASNVAAAQIEQHGIGAVIGPICPAVALKAAPLYFKAGVIQFVPTVTTADFTRQNLANVFRIAANDEQETKALGDYLSREQKGKNLLVVYTDVFYRRAMVETMKRMLPDAVKATARFEPLLDVPGTDDRLADALKRNPPDVIYMILVADQAVRFIGKIRSRGIKSVLVGGQHLLSQNFWRKARDAAEGVYVIAPIESANEPAFLDATKRLGQSSAAPDLVGLYSYAAVQTWAQALRKVGSGDSKKVIEALHAGEFSTAVGRIAFDQKGDRLDIQYSVLRLAPLTPDRVK